jgi:hypothetical protein
MVDINASSRKYQDAQHSKVGRVNLGARIAPNASRKCQEQKGGIIGSSRIYIEKTRWPKPAEKALKVDVENYSNLKMRHR